MALNQLPIVEATIQIVHSGLSDGVTFTTTLAGSDGAPVAPQQVFTFDLTVFAPDLVTMGTHSAHVEVYRTSTGDKVEVDVKVAPTLITLTFWEPVTPSDYRVKVIG